MVYILWFIISMFTQSGEKCTNHKQAVNVHLIPSSPMSAVNLLPHASQQCDLYTPHTTESLITHFLPLWYPPVDDFKWTETWLVEQSFPFSLFKQDASNNMSIKAPLIHQKQVLSCTNAHYITIPSQDVKCIIFACSAL